MANKHTVYVNYVISVVRGIGQIFYFIGGVNKKSLGTAGT